MKKTENSIEQKIGRMKDRSHSEPKKFPENIQRQERIRCFSMSQAATQFNIGVRALYKILRKKGHFIKYGRSHLPKSELIEKGYFQNKMRDFHSGTITGQYVQTYVTPSGMSFLGELIQNQRGLKDEIE